MNEKLDRKALEDKFYSQKFYFSYSGLNKLVYSPSLFYNHYILREQEDKTDAYLVEGKAIHCLLLDDGSFDKQFIISPSKLPSDNPKKVVDRVFAEYLRYKAEEPESTKETLADFSETIIEALKEINVHQSLKTDVQRIEKIVIDENEAYFNHLKMRGDKSILDQEMLDRCNKAVDTLRAHDNIFELLGLGVRDFHGFRVENELFLKTELEGLPFGLKGILDNLNVDNDKRTIFINDLKTTNKSLVEFPDTVNYYNYWMQIAIYVRLVKDYLRELLAYDWKLEVRFIVIDKYYQVYPFPVSETTLTEWDKMLTEKLAEAHYHYTSRNYSLPYRFIKNEVIL